MAKITNATINFGQVLTDLKGAALRRHGPDGPEDLTLKVVAQDALTSIFSGEEALPGSRRAKFGLMAIKLEDGDEHALTAEEIVIIKDRIGKGFAPLIVARAYALLDPADKGE